MRPKKRPSRASQTVRRANRIKEMIEKEAVGLRDKTPLVPIKEPTGDPVREFTLGGDVRHNTNRGKNILIPWTVLISRNICISYYESANKILQVLFAMDAAKDWEHYKLMVGEIRGLTYAREEIKALLEKHVDDVEDFISS